MTSTTSQLNYPNNTAYIYDISNKIHPDNTTVIVADDIRQARVYKAQLLSLQPNYQARLLILPDWETLAYDPIATDKAIISERLQTLYQLQTLPNAILIVPLQALLTYVVPQNFILKNSLLLRVGDQMTPAAFREIMLAKGYVETKEISQVGDFALRGAILDIYAYKNKQAYRCELFDTEIDSIRQLDVATQLSSKAIEHINLLPSQEYLFDKETKTILAEKLIEYFNGTKISHPPLVNLQTLRSFAGIEYYLPLLHRSMQPLWQYLEPKQTQWYLPSSWKAMTQRKTQQSQARYELQTQKGYQLLSPDKLFTTTEQLDDFIETQSHQLTHINQENTQLLSLPDIKIIPHAEHATAQLEQLLNQYSKVIIYAKDKIRLNNIQHTLTAHNLDLTKYPCELTLGYLEYGFIDTATNTAIVSENDLLLRVAQTRYDNQPSVNNSMPVIDDWHPGTLLVHRDYGIGKFLSFSKLDHGEKKQDFLVLEYANEDKLYVSVNHLHLVNKYIGNKITQVQLDQLGSKKWSQRKQKAYQACEDLAVKLLETHAVQKGKGAPICKIDDSNYNLIAEDFPYQTTVDQERTIKEVLHDIQQTTCMDRLVCGDVGFGKTEIAIRAAYVTILAGYQVALLTPTTLLAGQHYRTFNERFSPYPFKTALLSRLSTGAQSQQDITGLANGQVDIVIATHKLLSGKINFHKLGLIIIDEEHRFGVKQKEMIQAIKNKAHVLALSATPIPRTLHMALSSLRDMSIIQTPPKNRRAIQTFIETYNETTIQEAIQRELARGGQIYYMHNDISQHERLKENLHRLVPNMRIASIHGRLKKTQLEAIMIDFANQAFDLLLCTTIVESGIDIANANTIILHRADTLGLSQIHQLKGRVGRSNHQAYAYLFTPDETLLNREARARMDTIRKHTQLGAGYQIASEDLEIRGAGDLLGNKQTGHLHQIGMELYTKLLKRASMALQKDQANLMDISECEFETIVDCTIPQQYIEDMVTRLEYYRKIRLCMDIPSLDQLQNELQDRFGLLPKSVVSLLSQRKLQQKLESMNIDKIMVKDQQCTLQANTSSKLSAQNILATAQAMSYKVAFLPGHKIRFNHNSNKAERLQHDILALIS